MKAEPKAEPAAGGGSKKKLIMIVLIAVLVAGGGGGGAAWYFLHAKPAADEGADEPHGKTASKKKKKEKKVGPPVYVPLESFTVNLQPETGDQYLQTAITLQVAGAEQEELFKQNMPKVRSRLLLLLSSKKASEINTVDGKETLAKAIIKSMSEPFSEDGDEQEVADVMFTSFIIQ
jgi:flagellar FliL protein